MQDLGRQHSFLRSNKPALCQTFWT